MCSQLFPLCLLLVVASAAGATKHSSDEINITKPRERFCLQSEVVQLHGASAYELVLRFKNSALIRADMNCGFETRDGPKYHYLVSIVEADVAKDASYLFITDRKSEEPLVHDVNLHWSRRVFVSRSGSVKIRFSTRSYPKQEKRGGYRIRLERFKRNDCPPRWNASQNNFCVSPLSADFLKATTNSSCKADYATAQSVCNRLQANLLMPPKTSKSNRLKLLHHLVRFTEPVWIGLVSNSSDAPASSLHWLNKAIEDRPNQTALDFITCRSGYTWSSDACLSGERYGVLRPTKFGFLLMEQASAKHYFACSAPVGGADEFYPVFETEPMHTMSETQYYSSFASYFGAICGSLVLIAILLAVLATAFFVFRPRTCFCEQNVCRRGYMQLENQAAQPGNNGLAPAQPGNNGLAPAQPGQDNNGPAPAQPGNNGPAPAQPGREGHRVFYYPELIGF